MASLSLTGQGFRPRKTKGKPATAAVKPMVTADEAWELMADKFQTRFKKVKDAFVKMDIDCTGQLSDEEFRFTMTHVLGLEMTDEEYKKFWSRFDTSGDGLIDYAEFNNKLGVLIHPPAGQLLMNRPETPRIKDWQRKRMAAAVKTKMKNLEQAFNEIDTDGSGSISHAEFIQALRKLGLTKIGNEESFQMMQKYKSKDDENEDMSWEQFKRTMQDYMKLPDLPAEDEVDEATGLPSIKLSEAEKIVAEKLYGKFAHVQKAFRLFDEDKSGSLDYEEFKLALRSLGVNMSERDFRTMCMQYDKSGDGHIGYDEFNARVGPMLHPDAVNRSESFRRMEVDAGAQDGLVYNPEARLGLRAKDAQGKPLSRSARARLIAPRLGLAEGEVIIARQLYGRYGDVAQAFRDMDTDNSGSLNPKEFAKALEKLGVKLSGPAFKQLLEKYDESGDGEVSYDEFNASVGGFLVKSRRNDIMLGFAEERYDERYGEEGEAQDGDTPAAAASSSSSSSSSSSAEAAAATAAAAASEGKEEDDHRSAAPAPPLRRSRPTSARLPLASAAMGQGGAAASSVPRLALGSVTGVDRVPRSPIASPARSVRSVASNGSARSRPMSAASSSRKHRGMNYDRKTGFVASVKRQPRQSRTMGSSRLSARVGDGESSLDSAGLAMTEDKMRRILGKSWVNAYKDIRKQQERDAGNVISTHRFRDAMAERGVPLTSKEVRALARRYSAATHDPESAGRDIDYAQLMRSTFDPSSGRPLSELSSLPSSRIGRPTH